MNSLLGHPRKQVVFAALSVADLGLTWWLLQDKTSGVYESNPVAAWWLARFGWLGLAAFKAALSLLVLALVAAISRRRPQVGGRVLGFGCLALGLVVGYSFYLAFALPAEGKAVGGKAADDEWGAVLESGMRKTDEYKGMIARVSRDTRNERMTLQEAAELMETTERGRDPAWLAVLGRIGYPTASRQETLAAHVIFWAVFMLADDPATARAVALRLEGEFRVVYGNASLPHRRLLSSIWPQDHTAPVEIVSVQVSASTD